jgi:hypothetical protein
MSGDPFSDHDLLAWLDEQLPVDRMAEVERALRSDEALQRRTAQLQRRRDQGAHSVGDIWRRLRLSCPTRAELGSFLLGTLDPDHEKYVDFHLHTVGCRFCAAALDDMQQTRATPGAPETQSRRRKFFESSAGLLRPKD